MVAVLTENQIARYERERKTLPPDYHRRLFTFSRAEGFARSELEVVGEDGHRFVVSLRQGLINPLDFSAIFRVRLAGGAEVRLRRYNGKAHWHTNRIEREPRFYDFHVHRLTERYQAKAGYKPDGYAERTDRYGDLRGAVDCLFEDCGFVRPADEQFTLDVS